MCAKRVGKKKSTTNGDFMSRLNKLFFERTIQEEQTNEFFFSSEILYVIRFIRHRPISFYVGQVFLFLSYYYYDEIFISKSPHLEIWSHFKGLLFSSPLFFPFHNSLLQLE